MPEVPALVPAVLRRQAEGIRIFHGIALHISIPVQALTVCEVPRDDVLVDETADVYIVIALAHVVQAVCIRRYAAATIVQETREGCVSGKQLAVGAVGVLSHNLSREVRHKYRASKIIIMVPVLTSLRYCSILQIYLDGHHDKL